MSLKKFLNKIDVKAKFKEEFKKPRFKYSKDILINPLTANYGLVGTAFDYIARFHVEYVNKNNIVISRPWVAENYLSRSVLHSERYLRYEDIIGAAKEQKSQFLKTGRISDKLIDSVIRLSKIDTIYRSGYPEDETFEIVDTNDVEDIKKLYNVFVKQDWAAQKICFLNLTFNEASLRIGGADADLIIDDMLIELKSIKAAGMKRPDFDQLMGYYLLNEVAGISSYKGKHQINKIAVYSSRYGELMALNIFDVFDVTHLLELKEWFNKETL